MAFRDALEAEKRKAQELASSKAQAAAAEQYNTQKAQLDNKYNNGGLGGFLGQIVGGIGNSIGNIGYSLGGMFGTAGASIKDLLEGKAGTAENTKAFKRSYYGAENDKDAAAKAAGTSLNAAVDLATTAVPGLGAGSKAAKVLGGTATNTLGGALGGIADEFAQQGQNATFEGAANRAISGAAAGLATGGLNKKIGNATSKAGSALLNNRLATSAIGRGALSGAVGGATGAGTSAALGGGDVAQAALQGGLSGAASGATQAGIVSAGRGLLNRGKEKIAPTNVPETQDTTDTEFRAYGDSDLANTTKANRVSDALRRVGNTLEGAQSNVTRAAARDLGIESTGAVIENVRKKTGITNLDMQARLAKELTGGSNSLMDKIQNQALKATEDGKPFNADTSKIERGVRNVVNKYADDNILDVDKTIKTLERTVGNTSSDLITKANRLKSQAANFRGKGITDPTPKDAALAKIYTEIASQLDDLSYNAIPKSNVVDMFDATISEMRSRANQAGNNGNTPVENAYNSLADALDQQPRTIQAYRSFKKPFVDVSKIDQLTSRAENGAAQNLGQSAGGIVKKAGNVVLQRPLNAGLALAGAAANKAADVVDSIATPSGATASTPMSQNAQNVLGNYLGRSIGTKQASDAVQNARKAQEYQNLEDMFSGLMAQNTGTGSAMGLTGNYGMGGGYGAQTTGLNSITNQMNEISGAMNNALAAGDLTAYNQLASLYKSAYDTYKIQADMAGLGKSGGTSSMSTTEKNQLAKLQSAGTALDQLEQLYQKAGGGQGIIGGNIANFLGGLGLNSDVNTYNQLAQGLINQIGAAIGKTDSLNTEGEVQRALSLVPKITDDNQTAMNKIATLRSLLQTNTGTYNQLYGA